jgi:hypothetical protein
LRNWYGDSHEKRISRCRRRGGTSISIHFNHKIYDAECGCIQATIPNGNSGISTGVHAPLSRAFIRHIGLCSQRTQVKTEQIMSLTTHVGTFNHSSLVGHVRRILERARTRSHRVKNAIASGNTIARAHKCGRDIPQFYVRVQTRSRRRAVSFARKGGPYRTGKRSRYRAGNRSRVQTKWRSLALPLARAKVVAEKALLVHEKPPIVTLRTSEI